MIISAGSCGLRICPSLSIKLHLTKNTRHKVTAILKLCIPKWPWFIALCQCVSSYRVHRAWGQQTAKQPLEEMPLFWEAYSDRYRMCLCRPSGKAIKGLHSCWQVISASPATVFHLHFLRFFSYHLLERHKHSQQCITEKAFRWLCQSVSLSVFLELISLLITFMIHHGLANW